MNQPLKIRFVSDYVCPYCLLSKVPLEEACKGKDVEIEWLPYELTEAPAPQIDIYHDPKRQNDWKTIITPISERLGLNMRLPHVIPRPYTRKAFEGYHYAVTKGKGNEYNSRIYKAFFVDELDIGDPTVLAKLAGEIGLDSDDFLKVLEDETFLKQQEDAVRYAKDVLKIRSVPTIYIGEQKVEGSIYDKETFESLIQNALKKQQAEEIQVGASCGVDGCH